ncbi:MAG: lipase family protein [Acidimicrobiales bacterium]
MTATALLVLVPACSGSGSGGEASATDDAAATTTTTAPAHEAVPYEGGLDGFYADANEAPPTDLPRTLLEYAVADDVALGDATAYRIAYTSTSVAGDPIIVTGLASVPAGDAPDDGWPMLTISHGTTGIADECAPSKQPKANEFTLVTGLAGDRYLVAATDYEGLGTAGRHPYLVGESEGRSSIDALLAARQLPDAHPSDRFATMGYSQGGHGSLWTSQVAADWAPDLELVGTFSGAPASEVGVIVAAAPVLPQAGFAYMVIAGIAAAYPDEADPAELLTPLGLEKLDAVDEGCAQNTFAAVAGIDPKDLIQDGAAAREPWSSLAKAQDAGTEKTYDSPVLVIHSEGDGTVPLGFSEILLGRMCANDQVVERRLIDAGGHTAAAVPAYQQAVAWLDARFAGDEGEGPTAITDSCPS